MKKGIILAAILMIGVMFATPQAQAVPLTQQWAITNASPFDHIELYMLGDAANAFDIAMTHADGAPGWTAQLVNPDFVQMDGPEVTQLSFTTGFTDPATEHELFMVAFAAFNGDVLVEADWMCWNGGWGIFPMTLVYDRNDYDTSGAAAPVPEPGTMLLLGIGMVALAITSKLRKNAILEV
jgi:hypothetical protein